VPTVSSASFGPEPETRTTAAWGPVPLGRERVPGRYQRPSVTIVTGCSRNALTFTYAGGVHDMSAPGGDDCTDANANGRVVDVASCARIASGTAIASAVSATMAVARTGRPTRRFYRAVWMSVRSATRRIYPTTIVTITPMDDVRPALSGALPHASTRAAADRARPRRVPA